MSHGAGYPFTKSLPIPRSWHVLLSFLLKAFIFLPFTSRSAIRLELNFVDGMRQKVHHLFVSKWISNWPCTIYWKKNNCYPFPLHCSVSSDRHQVSLCSDLLLNSDLSHWFIVYPCPIRIHYPLLNLAVYILKLWVSSKLHWMFLTIYILYAFEDQIFQMTDIQTHTHARIVVKGASTRDW